MSVHGQALVVVRRVRFLGRTEGQEPIKFIAPEFVSYLGERGVPCVGKGFCETVLINKSTITLDVARLSICVFKKCSEKIYSRLNS